MIILLWSDKKTVKKTVFLGHKDCYKIRTKKYKNNQFSFTRNGPHSPKIAQSLQKTDHFFTERGPLFTLESFESLSVFSYVCGPFLVKD